VNNVLWMAETFKELLSAPASSSGYLWPVQGPSVHDITQYFCENEHRGLDIGAPEGTPVLAPVAGVIKTIWTSAQDINGGNSIVLHGVDGND
jgi:murein DD-endopeptidase MepM/ murein hydrolase activator NlpD